MPLKIKIGLSRKVGEAHYGSRGATVGLELEAEASLVHQPELFYEQVAHLFRLARASVGREMARPPDPTANSTARNGRSHAHERSARAGTSNQVRAIYAIARRQQLDLDAEPFDRFGVEYPESLSLVEASQFIDALKSAVRQVAVDGGGEKCAEALAG